MGEDLAAEFFRRSGVPAPGVASAAVSLNGWTLGLYVVKEGLNRAFFARSFPPGTGTFLRAALANQGASTISTTPTGAALIQSRLKQLAPEV